MKFVVALYIVVVRESVRAALLFHFLVSIFFIPFGGVGTDVDCYTVGLTIIT